MPNLEIKDNWGTLEFKWDGFELKQIHAVLIRWPDGTEIWHPCRPYEKSFYYKEQGHDCSGTTQSYHIEIENHGLILTTDIKGFEIYIKDIEVTLAPRTVTVPEERKRMVNLEAAAKDLIRDAGPTHMTPGFDGNRRSAQFDGSMGGDGRTPANSGIGGPDAASWV